MKQFVRQKNKCSKVEYAPGVGRKVRISGVEYIIRPSSRKNKKYSATIKSKAGRTRTVHFGHPDYQQYRDVTGLGLYSRCNHGDRERRSRYFARHEGVRKKNGSLAIDDPTSASFLSAVLLWPKESHPTVKDMGKVTSI